MTATAAELHFPLSAPAPDGELKTVAPGILWLRMPLPYALDHINLYLVRGAAGWTIVDTGLDTPIIRGLWDKILAGLDAPVVAIVCTHSHNDHAGLAGWLTEKLQVPLYMSRAEYFALRVFTEPPATLPWQHEEYYCRAGMPLQQVQELYAMLGEWSFMSPPPLAYRRLQEHTPLALGDGSWRVITGEGHSPEHASLFNEEQDLLFSGDQLLARISPNVGIHASEAEANPLQTWLQSLERIGEIPASTLVLPAHELPFHGAGIRAEQLRQHHFGVLERLEGYCRETPGSALALAQRLFPRRRGPLDDLLALSETQAHLIYLRDEQRIEQHLQDGIYRYG